MISTHHTTLYMMSVMSAAALLLQMCTERHFQTNVSFLTSSEFHSERFGTLCIMNIQEFRLD